MSSYGTAALVAGPVLLGALAQRTTGLGLALVGAPFIVVIIGPRDGVSFGNALQILLCVAVLTRTWRSTDVRAAALLSVPALAAVPFGALVVAELPEGPLLVLVGALATAAVVVSLTPAVGVLLRGTAGTVAAGALAGFVNVAAGVGGPMISAYALARRWPREVLIPTAQVVLLLVNVGALLTKGVPDVSPVVWSGGLLALAVGAALGERVSRLVDARTGRLLVTAIALAGGLATIVRGLVV